MRSRLTQAVALVAITVTIAFATTPPAAADPYWQGFEDDWMWFCGANTNPMPNVRVESCVLRNGANVRAAVVIGNHGPGAISIAAPHVELLSWTGIIYDRSCYPSTLNSGFARACFGPWTSRPCNYVRTESTVYVNFDEIETETGYVETAC